PGVPSQPPGMELRACLLLGQRRFVVRCQRRAEHRHAENREGKETFYAQGDLPEHVHFGWSGEPMAPRPAPSTTGDSERTEDRGLRTEDSTSCRLDKSSPAKTLFSPQSRVLSPQSGFGSSARNFFRCSCQRAG